MISNRVSTSEPQMALRPNSSRSRFFFGRPESPVVSESSQDTRAPLISQPRSKYYSFGKSPRSSATKVVDTDVIPPRQELAKKASKRSTSVQAIPSRSNLSRKAAAAHQRSKSEFGKNDIIGNWNKDVVQWTVAGAHELGHSNTSSIVPKKHSGVQTPDRFSPLPATISKAAAKRLGITVTIPNTASPPPQDSPVDWALSSPSQYHDRDLGFIPILGKSTFYSSESDLDDLEASLCSSESSRTSYNISTPLDVNLPSSPVGGKHQFLAGTPTIDDETMRLPILPNIPLRKSSKRVLRHTEAQHSPQNSTSSTDSDEQLQRNNTCSKPLPHRPNSLEADRVKETKPNDELRSTLNGMAVDIRNKLTEANNLPQPEEAIPAVPPRSRRRDWIKRVSSKSNVSNYPTRQESIKQSFAPLPLLPGRWVEPQLRNPVADDTHPAFRNPSPSPKPEEEVPITADAAELVIAKMLENLDNLKDLFAAARTNRGFYSVFKRHELRLMKQTVRNFSPAAWEMREASVKEIISSSEDSRVDYTPTRYLQFHRRDSYILAALKSLVVVRCQSLLRPETIESLRDRTAAGSKRVDDALWRIWTFCTIFGSEKGREDDIIGQMDWLRGGPFAHFATGVELAGQSGRKASIASASFGRGNIGGLNVDELFDMLEMWKCVKVLLQGIMGPGRVAQARKYGVFDSLAPGSETAASEEKMLEEWVAYLTTLGLSTVLDLATPSTSKTTRVFLTAADMDWTRWKPLANGASRSNFFQDAVTRVYNEELTAAKRATKPKASLYTSLAATEQQEQQQELAQPQQTPTTTTNPSPDTLMALWLDYQSRLSEQSTFPSNPSTSPQPLRPATSLSLFPPPSQSRSRSVSPAAAVTKNTEAGVSAVEVGVSGKVAGMSRFNTMMGGLKGKKSMPELRRGGRVGSGVAVVGALI